MFKLNALEILTGCLVIVTGYYVYLTHRMSSTTQKSFEAEQRPMIAFDKPVFELLGDPITQDMEIRIGIKLDNVGKVLASYNMDYFRVTLGGKTLDYPTFKSLGGHLYPTKSTIFFYDKIKGFNIRDFPLSGLVDFQMSYHAVPGETKYWSRRKIEFGIISPEYQRHLILEEDEH
ncbi:MAG TPA: hypothetical protein VFF29_07525 [Bacteroidota bacterium]|nr:hypothetical protein [Bacteroidota bacterium]